MARENPVVVVARIDAERAALLEALSDLMTFGLEEDGEIEGVEVQAGWPLTVRQAAKHLGKRVSRCRDMHGEIPFKELMKRKLDQLRSGERARNLATAIAIRDYTGLGLAADRTVQLKAISVIEGNEGKSAVVVNVNQTNNTATISPGYVIRLPARPIDALPDHSANAGNMIEAQLDRTQHVMIEQEDAQ